MAVARNRRALMASSPYVAFLDQDDLWMPHRNARLSRYLDADRDCSALVTNECSFYLVDDAEQLAAIGEMMHRTAEYPRLPNPTDALTSSVDDGSMPRAIRSISTRDLLGGTVTVTTSYVFDRQTLLEAGGCAAFARSLDDYWALLNVSRLTEIVQLDEPSILYRIHPASTTMSTSWSLPLLTSLVAVRFGGNLVPSSDARNAAVVAPLSDPRRFWAHQLEGLACDGLFGDLLDALALIRLLGCSRREQVTAGYRQLKKSLRVGATRNFAKR